MTEGTKELLKQLVSQAWTAAANSYRLYPDNKHTFTDFWQRSGRQQAQVVTESMERGERDRTILFLNWFATQTEYININMNDAFPMWQTHRIHEDQMYRSKMGEDVAYTAKTSEDVYNEFLLGKNPRQEDLEQRITEFYDKQSPT